MTNEEKINLIGQKILILSNNLDKYQSELEQLKAQLVQLQGNQKPVVQPVIVTPPVVKPEPKIEVIPEVKKEPEIKVEIPEVKPEIKQEVLQPIEVVTPEVKPVEQHYNIPPNTPKPASDFNFEAFIGGKLITIIGIIILVIGLGIGVKYAIDNDMLGPVARIALAYLAGGILLALAFKLKQKYKSFSAVLLSGGMASLYFTTFAAYSMYNMFPREAAFALMLVFTAFTVFAATMYNMQVIAVIGLVGAYAVPVLLNNHSGKIHILFSYMLIINGGILFLSFKKYWQVLNHFAFFLTWMIVGAWVLDKYNYETQMPMVMSFAFAFFITFYISSMSYKIVKQEKFNVLGIIHLFFNSFLFFGIGYGILNNPYYSDYLGIFTVANALVHFVFSYIVFKNKLLDRRLFYLLIAMVLTFITIAVPVQLEGNWVTLFWCVEAALLFIIGRYKNVRFYEWLGCIMIALSAISLLNDWSDSYYVKDYENNAFVSWIPFFNIHLLTSLFFVGTLGAMLFVHHKKEITVEAGNRLWFYKFVDYAFPLTLFCFTYMAGANELSTFFEAKYQQSLLHVPSSTPWADQNVLMDVYDFSWMKFKDAGAGIYSLVFFSIVTILAIKKWNNPIIRWTVLSFDLLIIFSFICVGLVKLSEMRGYYFAGEENAYFPPSTWLVKIRYVCFALFGIFLFLFHLLLKTETFTKAKLSKIYTGCLVHLFIIIVLSVELININILRYHDVNESYYHGTKTVYKLGLTALWGIYSFIIIAFGIFRRNAIIRISAISLFGITLVKLLIFDTWDLSTGYKVIAFILLGVILLIVAFLYQKFKGFIFDEILADGDEAKSSGQTVE